VAKLTDNRLRLFDHPYLTSVFLFSRHDAEIVSELLHPRLAAAQR
jgi:hypothetical protein